MSVLTITEEYTSPLPARRIFAACMLDADSLIPKVATQAVKGVEVVEGNGGLEPYHKFYPKAGVDLKEGDVKATNEKAAALHNAVDACLIANPNAYA